MKYKIRWVREDSGKKGVGIYIYDTAGQAQEIADELNRNKDRTIYTVMEAE